MSAYFHQKPVMASSGGDSHAGICDLWLAIHFFEILF